MLDVLELLELTLSEELLELLISGELLSVTERLGLLETLDEPLSELETPELCTELLAVLELCVEEDVSLASTLITVAPDVSDVALQPVRFAHITKSDSAAAKNLDFLFIDTTQLPFKFNPFCFRSSSITAPAYAAS